jgi:L,D-peptidoglycan transpeptidase YkuD (ErfK/YbiS/YcfS/YnhG family)
VAAHRGRDRLEAVGLRQRTLLTVALLPVTLVGLLAAACSSTHTAAPPSTPSSTTSVALPSTSAPPTTPAASMPAPSSTRHSHSPKHSAAPKRRAVVHTPARAHTSHALRLPLPFTTGNARQVITAVTPSTSSTEGTLQAWRKVPGGWQRSGAAIHAWFGSAGLTAHPNESLSATPIGSFTLTRAFGREADPGTTLPYTQTTPADWWISQSGQLYNTMQSCSGQCSFAQGDPNEHLYTTVPYYDYAVVIDYNTRNAPGGVHQGAGSAFFLHVTVGAPTQGCISIPQDQLVRLLRWLTPAQHPRILIGTA